MSDQEEQEQPGFSYDPTANPRSLTSPVAESDIEKYEEEREKLERELADLQSQIGMFGSKGWQLTVEELVKEHNTALNAMADPKYAPNNVALANLQGQIHAYRQLIQMSNRAITRQWVINQQLKQLRHPASDSWHDEFVEPDDTVL